MAMIDDRPAICDQEPADAEALFKEAKRRERRRRLGFAGIALLIGTAALIVATIGGVVTRALRAETRRDHGRDRLYPDHVLGR
jgi:hypothetical protein